MLWWMFDEEFYLGKVRNLRQLGRCSSITSNVFCHACALCAPDNDSYLFDKHLPLKTFFIYCRLAHLHLRPRPRPRPFSSSSLTSSCVHSRCVVYLYATSQLMLKLICPSALGGHSDLPTHNGESEFHTTFLVHCSHSRWTRAECHIASLYCRVGTYPFGVKVHARSGMCLHVPMVCCPACFRSCAPNVLAKAMFAPGLSRRMV